MEHNGVTREMRERIDIMYNREGASVPAIAEAVKLHESSVYRELKRGRTDTFNEMTGRYFYDKRKAAEDAAAAQARKGEKRSSTDGRTLRSGRRKPAVLTAE